MLKLLQLRSAYPEPFASGTYEPAYATGAHADKLCAFYRRHATRDVFVAVGRHLSGLAADWGDTMLHLSAGTWRNVITGQRHDSDARIGELFATLPVAVLIPLRD